ncbi:MAG: fructose-1,6-bisphosphatase [Treponema sp.]|nr:fructose-1,6-bisphosphatase [Treponema sp.]
METEKFLKILARQYPTERSVITELVNTQAILNLPKGTEHFITDIHGEYEQFTHVLRNGSGSIWQKIEDVFGNAETEDVKKDLATLIYYPSERLEYIRSRVKNIDNWYTVAIHRLVQMVKRVSSKYTRSHVRKMMSRDFAYIIEELITEKEELDDKKAYYNAIIHTVLSVGAAEQLIVAMCRLIQCLVIYRLHIIGDIYDRGPAPSMIMDVLMEHHSVDIQWGNHDIVWMGAAAGQRACIATVLRTSVHYHTMDVLEDAYGINLRPFVTFALRTYQGTDRERLHHAAVIMQYKLEGQLIKQYPEFGMERRRFLETIDAALATVTIDGKEWQLNSIDFPTIDSADPYKLSADEQEVMNRLVSSFVHCEKLQNHVRFLFENGSLYKVYNGNLLYHGCVPLAADGTFAQVNVFGKTCSGKALFDELERWARKGFFAKPGSKEKKKGEDILWYLWTGPYSPVFGKDRMTSFERVYVDDKTAHHETKNTYYNKLEDSSVIDAILTEFGLDTNSAHIVNGHVPQKVKKGETPIKCGGKLLIIDGGFASAYHETTGIAGYTLVSNSHGMKLVVHKKFESIQAAIFNQSDIISDTITVETFPSRRYMRDTEPGKEMQEHVANLEQLLEAYRAGTISPVSEL